MVSFSAFVKISVTGKKKMLLTTDSERITPAQHTSAMTVTETNQPQTSEFQKWFEAERNLGLLDIKFYLGDSAKSSCEDVLGEVNSMLKAEELQDSEIF